MDHRQKVVHVCLIKRSPIWDSHAGNPNRHIYNSSGQYLNSCTSAEANFCWSQWGAYLVGIVQWSRAYQVSWLRVGGECLTPICLPRRSFRVYGRKGRSTRAYGTASRPYVRVRNELDSIKRRAFCFRRLLVSLIKQLAVPSALPISSIAILLCIYSNFSIWWH